MANAKGIDVSYANGALSDGLLSQVDFVIVKASQGDFTDPKYPSHSAAVLKAHKVLGAYHWVHYGPGPTRQARTLLGRAGNAAFLALDDEERSALQHPELVRAIIANLHKLDPQHRKVLLYCSESHYPGNLGQDGNWIAHWGATPHIPYVIWQTAGVKLDQDEFHGTTAQLIAWSKTRRV